MCSPERISAPNQSAISFSACFGQAATASATADSISGGGSGRRMLTTSSSLRSNTSGASATHNALASQRSGLTVTFMRPVDHHVLLRITQVSLNACHRLIMWQTSPYRAAAPVTSTMPRPGGSHGNEQRCDRRRRPVGLRQGQSRWRTLGLPPRRPAEPSAVGGRGPKRSGPGPHRRRHRRLRRTGQRAELQHRPQRRAGRRLPGIGAGHYRRPSVRFQPAGSAFRRAAV